MMQDTPRAYSGLARSVWRTHGNSLVSLRQDLVLIDRGRFAFTPVETVVDERDPIITVLLLQLNAHT
jgi:hypothetical protein